MNSFTAKASLTALLTLITWGMPDHSWAQLQPRSSLSIDNDMFASGGLDRDYTGGVRFAITTPNADPDDLLFGERVLSWMDHASGWDHHYGDREHVRIDKTLGLGLLVFAPDDLAARAPIRGERPYASVLYASRSRFATHPDGDRAFQSTLTFGVLGLPLAKWAHRSIHRATGATIPHGYASQLSDGGEPTFRYALAYHRRLSQISYGEFDGDVRLSLSGSAGFITDLGASVTASLGRRRAGTWSLLSEQSSYLDSPHTPAPASAGGWVAWINVGVRSQLYNALLQGQFRNRAHALSTSQTETWIAEWGVGVTWAITATTEISYALRGRSREVSTRAGGRAMRWGGITLTRHLGR